MHIKDDAKFPPGGWVYFQPETGWWAPYPLAHDRFETAHDIVVHRRANPHKTLNASEDVALKDLETYTWHRLKGDPYYCEDGDGQKKTSTPRSLGRISAMQTFLKRVAQLAVGADTLREWVGDGLQPVPFPKAQERADVCEGCPKNSKGDWLNRITGPVAEAILRHMKLKTMLKLEVRNESELGICSACECQLPLKIWTPIEHINHNPETLARLHRADAKYNRDCWILSEKKALGDPAVS